ncbi:hypothetical protein BG015_000425 [Linnemannia schmuckeri]|uniref:Uncharacterized protein n=1 Tax=Linnemannia schmuckeri TaxID=64567 RepID=A0A9P5V7K6_9FUNG|nr:hypothetical protein BG015_000425 [Linnemannia schmuckeri]
MDDSRASHHNSYPSQGHAGSHSSDRYQGHPPSSSSSSHHQQHQHYQQQQHHHSHVSYPKDSRGHPQQSQSSSYSQDPDSGAAWRSPITPTTTRKFNRMAIHEVLESHQQQQQHPHPYGEEDSPPYRRRGSPDDYPYSDPPASSNNNNNSSSMSGAGSGFHPSSRSFGRGDMRSSSDHYHRGVSPRYRQDSPMPGSNSEDEDDDIRNNKKRRMVPGMLQSHEGSHQQQSPPSSSPSGPPEVMDQLRTTMKMRQQQKALIVSRQSAQQGGGGQGQGQGQPQQQPSPQQSGNGRPTSSNGSNQPITETTPSGLGVFHGSASFALLNRRPQPSPKNPKNAKSLTIFAPSYSESSLSIQSAPLQPSQSHQAMSMGLRTSQPLVPRHQHHPYAQPGSFQQPLRSPRTVGHAKKSSRATLRQPGPHAPSGEHSSSGTLPAPILSSHTGPLPSPMYPSTPFHSNLSNLSSNPKHMFMETVSNLFDSVDSSRSLKYTLEEQIRKSAQLLQTLQASGTMIENLVRGQFKELEKGVIERFESEIEHLNARVRQLEEHQGLTPPPRKLKSTSNSTTTPPTSKGATGAGAAAGAGAPSSLPSSASSGPVPMDTVEQTTSSPTPPHAGSSSPKHGTLPTPPFNKNQDTSSAMEVEDEGQSETGPDYNATFKGLGERVENLERRKE